MDDVSISLRSTHPLCALYPIHSYPLNEGSSNSPFSYIINFPTLLKHPLAHMEAYKHAIFPSLKNTLLTLVALYSFSPLSLLLIIAKLKKLSLFAVSNSTPSITPLTYSIRSVATAVPMTCFCPCH